MHRKFHKDCDVNCQHGQPLVNLSVILALYLPGNSLVVTPACALLVEREMGVVKHRVPPSRKYDQRLQYARRYGKWLLSEVCIDATKWGMIE